MEGLTSSPWVWALAAVILLLLISIPVTMSMCSAPARDANPRSWYGPVLPEPIVLSTPAAAEHEEPEGGAQEAEQASETREVEIGGKAAQPKKWRALCINLDNRPDRWEQCQKEWSAVFDLQRLSAVRTPERGSIGCRLSHAKAIRTMQETQEDFAIVLEDDAVRDSSMTPASFAQTLAALDKVDGWYVFYGGPNLCLPNVGPQHLVQLTAGTAAQTLFATPAAYMAQFVVYHRRALEVVQALEDAGPDACADTWFSDRSSAGYSNRGVLVCGHYYAKQRPSFSNIENRPVDHSGMSECARDVLAQAYKAAVK